MKKNFYTTLLIGLGLTIASAESFAKPDRTAIKKTVSAASKHTKAQPKKEDGNKKSATKIHSSGASSKDNNAGKKSDSAKHSKKSETNKHAQKEMSGKSKKKPEGGKHARKEEHTKHAGHGKHEKRERLAKHHDDENTHDKPSENTYSSRHDDDRIHHVILGQSSGTKKAFSSDESPALDQAEWGMPFVINNASKQSKESTLQIGTESSSESKLQIGDNGAAKNVLQTQTTRELAGGKKANNRMQTLIDSPKENTGGAIMSAVTGSVHITFDDSVSLSHQASALSKEMVAKLAEIFAWDVDFANSIHPGDKLTVVFEKDSEGKNGSSILAAQFVSGGKSVTAIRYRSPEGKTDYYTPEGKTLRKAFLSSPVDYIKISSHFDPHRMHPILNRIRAHKGVDYAARTGTPVKAAGDGTVSFVGNKGAYGQMLILEHGAHYETVYAHLSKFKQGLKVGDHVRQGEVVAYVGQTGLATGPHLHYEFRVDGVHQNPESVTTGESLAIENRYWSDFHAHTVPILTQLNQAKTRTVLADNLE